MTQRSAVFFGALFAVGAALGACSDPNTLAAPTLSNVEDTITLYATSVATLQQPNAFSITNSQGVRTWQTIAFEFSYDVGPGNSQLFIPLAVLGLSPGTTIKPGLLKTALPFDQILVAAQNGYITTDTVTVQVGDVYLVRSNQVCAALGLPQYGKIEILSADTVAKSITFRALSDNNCGYRGLQPGLPKV